MNENAYVMDEPALKDRKVGLVIFGVLQIIMGGLLTLMVPLMIVGMVISNTMNTPGGPPVDLRTTIPGLIFYGALAIWFIWVGIGSIMARRWARALILVSSWIWLIGGAFGLISVLLFLPDIFAQMGRNQQMPPEALAILRYAMIGFMAVIYCIIPAVLILFYGSRHTKATCEHRDLIVRWTDRCPLPVLAVSLISAGWGLSILLMGFYGWTAPFFGALLTGSTGAVVLLATAALFAYVAWGTYRLDIRAWFCAAALILAWGVSAGITFFRVNLIELYEKMGFPAQQLELMKEIQLPTASSMAILCGVWTVVILGYLLFVRRYFVSAGEHL